MPAAPQGARGCPPRISSRRREDGLEIDIDLAEMNALGMLVELGAAGAAADRRDFRHVHQKTFGDQPEPVGLAQRNAGIVLQADVERALREWRQEGARQRERRRRPLPRRPLPRRAKIRSRRCMAQTRSATIGALEMAQKKAVMVPAAAARRTDSRTGPASP